jgi:predicted O-methyltransferase YrrM
MSLQSILDYVRTARPEEGWGTVGEAYGTENFCIFLYSLIKMEKPSVVVELGVGAAVTSCLAAQALKENNSGMLWGVDNGSAWNKFSSHFQAPLGYKDEGESYASYLRRLLQKFELEPFVTHVERTIGPTEFYAPEKKIDILFADATDSGPEGCIYLLRYYLPRMSEYSSVFIDRASTINHSYLLLNYVVEQLNRQKIPLHLLRGLTPEQEAEVRSLVSHCRFTLVHLTDHSSGKSNLKQNSRAWIKIEPCDFLPQNQVSSFTISGKEIGTRGSLL